MGKEDLCWGEQTSEQLNNYQPCVTCPTWNMYLGFISGKNEADPKCYPRLKKRKLWKDGKPDRGAFTQGPIVGPE